MQKDHAIAKTR